MLAIRILLASAISCAATSASADEEPFDRVVEREMFKFRHYEDRRLTIDAFKREGKTDEMFADAFANIANRTMNASAGSEEARKCHSSIDGLLEFGSAESVKSNLMHIVRNSCCDATRGHAIWGYHEKVQDCNEFVGFAEELLSATNLGHRASSQLFSCLAERCKNLPRNAMFPKERIFVLARTHLSKFGKGSLVADTLLLKYDPCYKMSDLRRRFVNRMLDPNLNPFKDNPQIDTRHVLQRFQKAKLEMREK